MKKLFAQFTIAVLFSITILSAQTTTSEQDAIRKVIEDETRAIQLCDFNHRADYWRHEPYCYFFITNPDQACRAGTRSVPGRKKIAETARLTLKPDGKLHLKMENYGGDGKVNFGFSVELMEE